mmetsp:Transcript_38103/g.89261  ORF Transcript_38103/g.89261 Transcript_38103/m.89261 type:complete len:523 (+) Transcript_38103:109-1677(+)
MHGWDTNGDWLFHSLTGDCGEGLPLDNDPSSAWSLQFLIGLYLAAAVTVALISMTIGTRAPDKVRDDSPEETPRRNHDVEDGYQMVHMEVDIVSRSPTNASREGTAAIAPSFCGVPVPNGEAVDQQGLTRELMCSPNATTPEKPAAPVAPKVAPTRKLDLDFARIICVACVVTEHSGGGNFSKHNTFFVLQWVLPFLYVTSGLSFMLSKASIWVYTLRLLVVFCVGTAANWTADIVSGWHLDVGNTVFQMWYVMMLMVVGLALHPTRRFFRWRIDHPSAEVTWKNAAHMLLWAGLAVVGFIAMWAGMYLDHHSASTWLEHKSAGLVKYAAVVIAMNSGIIFLANLGCALGPSSLHGWIVLLVLWVVPIVVPFQDIGYANNIGLYVWAMVVQTWPLKGSKRIAKLCTSYWPVIFIILVVLSPPDQLGRCDTRPLVHVWDRFRFYTIEYILVTVFVTGALRVSDPLNLVPSLARWALYAYCFHVMWYRMLGVPWGALVSFLSVFPFVGFSYVRGELCPLLKEPL